MTQVQHQKDPEVANLSIQEIAERYVARFIEREPDWDAFADAGPAPFHRRRRFGQAWGY